MSPQSGTASTGQPQARARAIVPWPAWQITAAHAGIVLEYDTHSTRRVLAGTSTGSPTGRRFQVARTRIGSKRWPTFAVRSMKRRG